MVKIIKFLFNIGERNLFHPILTTNYPKSTKFRLKISKIYQISTRKIQIHQISTENIQIPPIFYSKYPKIHQISTVNIQIPPNFHLKYPKSIKFWLNVYKIHQISTRKTPSPPNSTDNIQIPSNFYSKYPKIHQISTENCSATALIGITSSCIIISIRSGGSLIFN